MITTWCPAQEQPCLKVLVSSTSFFLPQKLGAPVPKFCPLQTVLLSPSGLSFSSQVQDTFPPASSTPPTSESLQVSL